MQKNYGTSTEVEVLRCVVTISARPGWLGIIRQNKLALASFASNLFEARGKHRTVS